MKHVKLLIHSIINHYNSNNNNNNIILLYRGLVDPKGGEGTVADLGWFLEFPMQGSMEPPFGLHLALRNTDDRL